MSDGTSGQGYNMEAFASPFYRLNSGSDDASPVVAGDGTPAATTSNSSPAQQVPSLSLDNNSGCIRLTPLVSLNFTSTLTGDAFWYTASRPVVSGSYLPSGHTYTSENGNFTYVPSNSMVGSVGTIQNSQSPDPTDIQQFTHSYFKVYGSDWGWQWNGTALDQISSSVPYQSNNIWSPNGGTDENGWKEEYLELASSTGDTPETIIRSGISNNPAYMFAGQDPGPISLFIDIPGSVYNDVTNNIAAEYSITSEFSLPLNSSFSFAFKIKKNYGDLLGGNNASPAGLPYIRLYFGGQYAFQYDGQSAYFVPDTTVGDTDTWDYQKIKGLKLDPYNKMVAHGSNDGAVILVFECIGSFIVITNALDVGAFDTYEKRPGWGYDVNKNNNNEGDPILATFPTSALTVGVRAVHATFSYIPIVYPLSGTITSNRFVLENTNFDDVVATSSDTTETMGGDVEANIVSTDDSFFYFIEVVRGLQVDCSPSVCYVDIRSKPTFSAATVTIPPLTEIRDLSVTLGMDSQGGSFAIDNSDGAASTLSAIFPVEISAGWNNDNAVIFKGYAQSQNNAQFTNNALATYSLMGADCVLTDAILINAPIYDGFLDNEAVQDIIDRAGWLGDTNIQGGNYQLSIPAYGIPPKYMFPMGTSALEAIRQIAIAANMWAYVDGLGVFNYIPPFSPNPVVTPDVWTSISQYTDTSNIRNAVLVVGLANYDSKDGISLIFSISKDTTTSLIPWNRWIIYQDAKVNTQADADAICQRLFTSWNRERFLIQGTVWGDNTIIPFGGVIPDLVKDTLGLKGTYRILTCNHTMNSDDNTGYFVTLEAEYDDGTATNSYVDWWTT